MPEHREILEDKDQLDLLDPLETEVRLDRLVLRVNQALPAKLVNPVAQDP